MTDVGAVVIPAIAAGSSIACFRSLGRQGIRTIGLDDGADAASGRSKYCDELVTVPAPSADLEGYAAALLELAKRPDVATFVPLREGDSYVLAKYRDEFAKHVYTPWRGFDTLDSVRDRYQLYDRAKAAGVAVPRTAPLDEWDGWKGFTVVKPRYTLLPSENGSLYGGVHFFGPETAPTDAAVEALIDAMGHVPMAQEYVPGDREQGFFALCDEGESVVTFQHRRLRSYSYTGGASVYRESVRIPALADAGARLLRELNWHGPAMAEFKYDPRDDAFKLLEVNPRFWGSLSLACAAGVDFPYRYYQLATGTLEPQPDTYETGVGCHLLRGEVSYLASILTESYDHIDRPPLLPEIRAVGASMLQEPNFDYFAADDPKPFAYDLFRAAKGLVA